jgi:GNAT superfamily N-acetyltransferase
VDVSIREARPAEVDAVRAVVEEYIRSLGIDLSFQQVDAELADLATAYAPPGGRILIALGDEEIAGCVALRSLEDGNCEMKRLYVRPAYRGTGLGRRLALAVIEKGRELGYERMRIDTLPQMQEARTLYASLGFREIAPYRFNPVPGTAFMELELR